MGEGSYLIENLTIYDGKGNPPIDGALLIEGSRISAVGEISSDEIDEDVERIDADGLCAAPGFVNIHSHSDTAILMNPHADNLLMQGITTEVGGNCGFSACFPAAWDNSRWKTLSAQGLSQRWNDVETYLAAVKSAEPAVNYATLIGHGSVRQAVAEGSSERLTEEQMDLMNQFIRTAILQGAWGVSTGLEYLPGRFADTNELVKISKTVADLNGMHSCHLRDEGNDFLDAVDEAVEIAERSGVRMEVAHLKVCGQLNWGEVEEALDKMRMARQKHGANISADFYPYLASSTSLSIILPDWALQEGAESALELLDYPDTREKVARDVQHHTMVQGGWSKVVVTGVNTEANRNLQGKSIAEISTDQGCSPVECALNLIQEEGMGVRIARFAIGEDDLREVISAPTTCLITDGSVESASQDASLPHPRSFGAFPRFLAHYARDEQVIPVEKAIQKMTSLPAEKLNLPDRGVLQEGKPADVVIFDLDQLSDCATYSKPRQHPEGIHTVFVNGEPAVWEGQSTGNRNGMVLKSM